MNMKGLVNKRCKSRSGTGLLHQVQVTSRKGDLRTIRFAVAVSGDSKRSEASLTHPFVRVPGVIAGEVDLLPAERRDMPEQGAVESV